MLTLVYLAWVLLGLFQSFIRPNFIVIFFIYRYGSPYEGYVVANHTLHGMLWLAQYEFAMPERQSKLGTMMWPEWYICSSFVSIY